LSNLAASAGQTPPPLVIPSSPCVGGVSAGIRFPFWFAPSELAASPSSLCQAGPGCQLHPSPPAARARPRHHRFSATPRSPALRLGCCRAVTTPNSFPPPLIPLLTPPIFNGVKAINAGVNPWPPLPGAPPTPIKGEHHPRTSPHLSQPLFSSLHARASLPPSAAAFGSAPPSPGLHVAPPPRVRP
jgi:hypothetical protein